MPAFCFPLSLISIGKAGLVPREHGVSMVMACLEMSFWKQVVCVCVWDRERGDRCTTGLLSAWIKRGLAQKRCLKIGMEQRTWRALYRLYYTMHYYAKCRIICVPHTVCIYRLLHVQRLL